MESGIALSAEHHVPGHLLCCRSRFISSDTALPLPYTCLWVVLDCNTQQCWCVCQLLYAISALERSSPHKQGQLKLLSSLCVFSFKSLPFYELTTYRPAVILWLVWISFFFFESEWDSFILLRKRTEVKFSNNFNIICGYWPFLIFFSWASWTVVKCSKKSQETYLDL